MNIDSAQYLAKKKFFSQLLTIYGRKPVLEALSADNIDVYRIHLANSNKPAKILDDILEKATSKNAEILYHSRDALSQISKNKKQDQGVAIDLKLHGFQEFDDFVNVFNNSFELLALDGVTNPQNLGLIIRSVCASPLTGLLLPRTGGAKIDSLVIKASAGTLFKAHIVRCNNLSHSLQNLKQRGAEIIGLDSAANDSLSEFVEPKKRVFVLGNESHGLSKQIQYLCDRNAHIPMQSGVESLNVAITAALIAFRNVI